MKNLKNVLHIILLFIVTIVIIGTTYLRLEFPDADISELLFYLNNGVTHSDSNVFIEAIIVCVPYLILVFALLIFIFYDLTFNHNLKFYPFKLVLKHKTIFTLGLIFLTLLIVCQNLFLVTFFKNELVKSSFIEKKYINPKEVEIEFTEKKNLVFIVVESLETSLMDKDSGGSFNENYIPELESLLKDEDATVFYSSNNKSGMKMLKLANWTTASVIANTSGVPFKVSLKDKFTSSDFLNGAYTLYDLLADIGYHNEAISAAYTSFGGIYDYLTKHQVSDIIDAENLDKYNLKMQSDDVGPWGFNDNYLYEIAKERLNTLASQKEPFSMTLITIDTHFPNGFIGNYSTNKFKNQYANSYATESKLIYDFISWIKKQPFYEDTVIVIIGDHLSMQKNFFKDIDKNSRLVYTCYINSSVKASNTLNRKYTALDTYATILGAMGAKINNNRMGLGSNMFSDEITLAEKYGFDYLNQELLKKSIFYNQKLK